jgi:DNA repair protein RadC
MKFKEVKLTTVRVMEDAHRCDDASEAARAWQKSVTTASWYDPMKEMLVAFLLDTRNHLSSMNLVSIGSVSETVAHPREILRPAILCSAQSIVIMHNHPSGNASPSEADRQFTRRLRDACEIFRITLMDHLIITERGEFFSFRESGMLN